MFVSNPFPVGTIVSFYPKNSDMSSGEFMGVIESSDDHNYYVNVRYRVLWRTDGTYTIRDFAPTTERSIVVVDRKEGMIGRTNQNIIVQYGLDFGV